MELKVAVIVVFLAATAFGAPFDPIYGDNERKEPSAWETLKEGAKSVFHIGQSEDSHQPIETHHDYHRVEYPADSVAERAVQESQRIAEQVAHERIRRRAEEQRESPRPQNRGGSSSSGSEGLPPQGALEIMYKQQKERENKPQPTFIEELKSGWEKATIVPSETADRIGEKWEETKEKSRETLDQAKQKVAEGWDATKEGAANAGEKIKETFSRDKNTKIAIPPAQQPQ